MSYLVLARKYRPRTFSEMVGQEHVVQALTNALSSQRLHHAYLFTGTRGVGKTTVSRVLAKSLNCQGPDGQGGITAEPCGVCQACTDIDAGRFVDYTELDAASNRGVDEVQQLLEQAVYKPVQGRFKVFMIDEVHMLTNTAFNAMLKTLEEPPEYLKFVLATTDPQKVPVTVLSRCLQFNLRPMAPETVLEHLTRVLAAENIAAEPQALRLIARSARGSMRDALSLTDQAIAYGAGQLQEDAVRQMLGSADRTHVFQLIEALAQGDGKTVVETTEAMRVQGLNAASTLEDMTAVLQRMAVLQAVPDMQDAADTDPESTEIVRLAALMPADETQLLYSLCLHGRTELGLAPDEYAAMTMVLLRLLAFKSGDAQASHGTAEKKSLNLARAEPKAGAAPVAAPVNTPPASVVTLAASTPAASMTATSTASSAPRQAPAQQQVQPALPAQAVASQVVAVPVREQPEPTAPRERPQPTHATPHLEITPEGDFWFELVQSLVRAEAVAALVRELALQSQLIARDADVWMLRIERESLNNASSRERLQTALAQAGHTVRLTVEIGRVTDSPALRNAAAAAERQQRAEAIILNDPYVQGLMRDFGAKIVPGSIKPV
jgi:DNA polymerase-3 subunit gamma/tau